VAALVDLVEVNEVGIGSLDRSFERLHGDLLERITPNVPRQIYQTNVSAIPSYRTELRLASRVDQVLDPWVIADERVHALLELAIGLR
jgi:hypothetical protein